MKKLLTGIVVSMVVVIALASAGYVYAQGTVPPTPAAPGWGGMMGGRGYQGGMMGGTAGQTGILHDDMVEAFAQKLGLTVDEISSRLSSGETMYQIALSKGITAEQFPGWMAEVRSQALAAAVNAGELTQEQADWMSQHGAGMMAGRGARMGRGMNAGACPYFSQTNP